MGQKPAVQHVAKVKFEQLFSYVIGVDVKDVTKTSEEVEQLWLGLAE